MARYRWKKQRKYGSDISDRVDHTIYDTDGGACTGEAGEPAGADALYRTDQPAIMDNTCKTGKTDEAEDAAGGNTEVGKSTERENYLSMKSITEINGQEEKTEKTDKTGISENADHAEARKKREGDAGTDNQQSRGDRGVMIRTIALAAAAVLVILLVFVWVISMNKKLTVIAPIGNITFIDKHRENDICYVTFEAADFNRIPQEMNEQGITVRVDQATYDLLALDVEYGSANVVFEVPRSAARKAGFDEAQMNVQNLWTDKILTDYATIRSIVWSVNY